MWNEYCTNPWKWPCWYSDLSSNDPFGISLQLYLPTRKARSSCFFPPWLNSQQGLVLKSTQFDWLVTVRSASKQRLMKRFHPFDKGGFITQKTESHPPLEGTAAPSKFKTIVLISSSYHFFAISHGVTPLRWQKRTIQVSELKVTASNHCSSWGWSHNKLFWHTSHASDFSQHKQICELWTSDRIDEGEHGSQVTVFQWQSGTVRFIALSSYLVTVSCKLVHGTCCPCRPKRRQTKKKLENCRNNSNVYEWSLCKD